MDSIGALESAGLALKVQTTLQRKQLDYQAQNFLTLLEGLNEVNEQIRAGRDDSLGKVVDFFA